MGFPLKLCSPCRKEEIYNLLKDFWHYAWPYMTSYGYYAGNLFDICNIKIIIGSNYSILSSGFRNKWCGKDHQLWSDFLTMENPETFPPGGRPQHQNHPIPSNWYDTLDRNANISLNSKGLRNAPGENNCFLNSAVQVRIFFYHLLSFYHIIMYWGHRSQQWR